MTWTLIEYATEADWLEARRRYITSSDVSAILGVSPYTDHGPFQVWLDKTGAAAPRDPGKMRRRFEAGHRFEELHRQWFAEDTGLHPFRPAAGHYLVTNPALPWAACTPDLLVIEPEAEGVVEGKSAGLFDQPAYTESGAFLYANAQLHHGMNILEMERGWVATSFGVGHAFQVYPVNRDPALSQLILDRCGEFAGYVERREPPPSSYIDGAEETKKAIARIFDQESGETIELEPDFRRSAERLLAIPSEIAALTAEQNVLKSELMLRMGSASIAKIPGVEKVAKFAWRGSEGYQVPAWRARVLTFVNDPATKKGRKK
jgi:predicted phage-related endonuclease